MPNNKEGKSKHSKLLRVGTFALGLILFYFLVEDLFFQIKEISIEGILTVSDQTILYIFLFTASTTLIYTGIRGFRKGGIYLGKSLLSTGLSLLILSMFALNFFDFEAIKTRIFQSETVKEIAQEQFGAQALENITLQITQICKTDPNYTGDWFSCPELSAKGPLTREIVQEYIIEKISEQKFEQIQTGFPNLSTIFDQLKTKFLEFQNYFYGFVLIGIIIIFGIERKQGVKTIGKELSYSGGFLLLIYYALIEIIFPMVIPMQYYRIIAPHLIISIKPVVDYGGILLIIGIAVYLGAKITERIS